MSKKVFLFLAEGFEEIEALTPIDVLRRAGVEVTTVAVGTGSDLSVTGAHGVEVKADILMKDIKPGESDFDALVCPGGLPGSSNLAADKDLLALLKQGDAMDKHIAALCAAPAFVLGANGAGLLEGRDFTTYPGAEGQAGGQGNLKSDGVVVDGKLITGRGPGFAFDWSLEIVTRVVGSEAAAQVREQTLYN